MFDKYEDVAVALDRELLSRPIPPSHVRASTQLKDAEIEFKQIVAVNPEAILYVDMNGRAWTAWSEVRANDKVILYRQKGFPAFPSPYLKDGS